MLLLSLVEFAQASEVLKFNTAAPVLDSVRRLEGKLGVPINVDLGPTHHRIRIGKQAPIAAFSVEVPGSSSGLADSLVSMAQQVKHHPSWDGCLELEVSKTPLTVKASQVVKLDITGNIVGCTAYISPMDTQVSGTAGKQPRTFSDICQEAGIAVDDSLDPLTAQSKVKSTVRTMLDASTGNWSYSLTESVVSDRYWSIKVTRPGHGTRGLPPEDYPYHPEHEMAARRAQLDKENPGRHADLQALKNASAAYEAAIIAWRANGSPESNSNDNPVETGNQLEP